MTKQTHGALADKIAIITGGGSGLGAATAQVFASEGAKVVIAGRREAKLRETVREIARHGGEASFVVCDMAKPADVQNLITETVRRYGGLDILINSAGRHGQFRRLSEIELIDFDDFMFTNLRGPFVAIQSAAPHMIARGGGGIVNIASMAGLVGLKYAASYSAVKGGLVQLTKAIAVELADYGITVNCVAPGLMTPTESGAHVTPEERALVPEAVNGGAPIKSAANVFDVARFIGTLVGPGMSNMTGAIIPFDGGYIAR